jgi:hypothetical protein
MADEPNTYDRVAQMNGEKYGTCEASYQQWGSAERAEAIRMMLNPRATGEEFRYARKAMGFSLKKIEEAIAIYSEDYFGEIDGRCARLDALVRWTVLGMLLDGVQAPDFETEAARKGRSG